MSFSFSKRLSVAAAAVALGSLLFAGAAAEDTTSLEGKAAPEVALKTVDGKPFKLSALKGNVVVLGSNGHETNALGADKAP